MHLETQVRSLRPYVYSQHLTLENKRSGWESFKTNARSRSRRGRRAGMRSAQNAHLHAARGPAGRRAGRRHTLRATLHVPRSRLVMLWTCRCLWQVSSARPRQPRLSVFPNTCHCNPFEALLIRNSQLTLCLKTCCLSWPKQILPCE